MQICDFPPLWHFQVGSFPLKNCKAQTDMLDYSLSCFDRTFRLLLGCLLLVLKKIVNDSGLVVMAS